MITSSPLYGNTQFSNIPENPKLSFFLSCVASSCHIFPLHLFTFTADGTPQCACGGGSHCTGPGKHPLGRWSKPLDPASRRTPTVIRNYVEKWPDRGWGIHLGLSRLVCVDVDPRNGGLDGLAELRSLGIIGDIEPHVTTGGGGFHFYFTAPDNVDPRAGWRGPNSQTRTSLIIATGVEFLCGQHFMVLPHSPHKNGGSHVWHPDVPLSPMPQALIDRVNSRPVFEVAARTSSPGGFTAPSSGRSPGTPNVDAAHAYLATMEPAVSGKEGSRRTGRVASVLVVDFGLDRYVAKELLREWNAACDPPWTDKELDRKLDWAETRPGTRGWRNNTSAGGLTGQEKKLEEMFAEIPLNWGRRLLNVTTGEMIDVKAKKNSVCPEEFHEKNGQSQQGGADLVDGSSGSLEEEKAPRCHHYRTVILKRRGASIARVQAFPCRRLDCEGCFSRKRQWYIDTQRHWLWKWEREHGGARCPPLYMATIPAQQWPRLSSRLRRLLANFFRLDPLACGSLGGISFLVVATAQPLGPAWQEVSPSQAAAALAAAAMSFSPGLQRRVWWSSRPWKLIHDDPKPEEKWERIGKPGCTVMATAAILEAHGVDHEPTHGGGGAGHGMGFSSFSSRSNGM